MERPDVVAGHTIGLKTGCGTLFLTLNYHEGKLCEVKTQIGKSGNCPTAHLSHESDMYSEILRNSNKWVKEKVFKTGLGVTCNNPFFIEGDKNPSCIHWICKTVLEELAKDKEDAEPKKEG